MLEADSVTHYLDVFQVITIAAAILLGFIGLARAAFFGYVDKNPNDLFERIAKPAFAILLAAAILAMLIKVLM